MLDNDPRIFKKSENYVVELIKSVDVIEVAISVKRVELISLHKNRGELYEYEAK